MTVEYECGFSVYPPLPPTPSNQSLYALFLTRLKTSFSSQVVPSASKPLLITDTDSAFYYFTFPKYPKIPANPGHCNYFLSFRLNFGNGGLPREVAVSQVLEVFVIAKEYFGERVRYWNGMHRMRCNKQWGYYTLADVEEAEKEVRKLCRSMDFKVTVMETVVETMEENNAVEVGPLALLG
ncbi:set 5 [Fusarium pseudoanthophilum]|uniref:Set 5 n=1 Tax=Fusarium pseudoanthophilum TaxID=48495 RepID=A0A8H5NVW7_9HYPO|nr:set 5 [Fusarium pseudoanthophilum]